MKRFGSKGCFALLGVGLCVFAIQGAHALGITRIRVLPDLLIRTAVVGDLDRRTEQQFADENNMTLSQVQQRFAATGELVCGPWAQTANLALLPNLVVTAGHMFKHIESMWGGMKIGACEPTGQVPEQCVFRTRIGAEVRTEEVARAVAAGYDGCPSHRTTGMDDWVILKLKRPIGGVQPYGVWPGNIRKGQKVVSVEENFLKGDFRTVTPYSSVKSIGSCTIRNVYYRSFGSDCDSTKGNSGSAVLNLKPKEPPAIVGITSGSYETREQLLRAFNTHRAYHCDYKEGSCATMHIPLAGKFFESLLTAARDEGWDGRVDAKYPFLDFFKTLGCPNLPSNACEGLSAHTARDILSSYKWLLARKFCRTDDFTKANDLVDNGKASTECNQLIKLLRAN